MVSTRKVLLSINGGQKIQPTHRQRLACIYIRQSSLKQVRENTESQVNQYRLQERASDLGWASDQIRIIDSDQGISGSSSDGRLGYQEILSLVSLGKVGIIFGYEVSRLARNNADWYPLLQLADIFGVLIADNDAIYDPKDFNDRMVLGLKGALSELELHLIRQRLDTGRMNKILRADYRQPLPTGLVRERDGKVYQDPDEQIRHTIQLILDKFAELGSCSKVLQYMIQHRIQFPRRQVGGALHGETLWKEPSYTVIHSIIKNPAYAGAFAHGRTQVDPPRRIAIGNPRGGRVIRPQEGWIHLQQDVYPAYISWEQYLANQEQLRKNATTFETARTAAQGAAREGSALLQGLVRCGCCAGALWARMQVRYRSAPTYACSQMYDSFGQKSCLFIHANKIDPVVVQAFFDAIQPAQLNALALLLEQQKQEQGKLEEQWQQKLQRAEYDARRAERQYGQVDPENRLVASTLEKRWEESLNALHKTQPDYQLFQQTTASPTIPQHLQQQFRHLSNTLPNLWTQLTNEQKKELLRTLISQVILTLAENDQVAVRIVWVSGHFSTLSVKRYSPLHSPPQWEDLPHYPAILSRIHELWLQGIFDQEIARILNNEGLRSLEKTKFNRVTVLRLRLKQGWQHRSGSGTLPEMIDGRYTVRGLANACNAEMESVRWQITAKTIPPDIISRHPQLQIYLFDISPELLAELRVKAANRRYYNKRKEIQS
jgi:DNA invertase Pin-like site-specific DNA recombinase